MLGSIPGSGVGPDIGSRFSPSFEFHALGPGHYEYPPFDLTGLGSKHESNINTKVYKYSDKSRPYTYIMSLADKSHSNGQSNSNKRNCMKVIKRIMH